MLYEKFHHLYDSKNITLLLVIIALLIITGINYVVLVFLFRNYDQRQIRKISQTFPEYFIQEENPTTFTELGENYRDEGRGGCQNGNYERNGKLP